MKIKLKDESEKELAFLNFQIPGLYLCRFSPNDNITFKAFKINGIIKNSNVHSIAACDSVFNLGDPIRKKDYIVIRKIENLQEV